MRLCFYFQVHQPYRLNRTYSIFDIGTRTSYFDDSLNQSVMSRVSQNCYLPTNKLLLDLIRQWDMRCAFSITQTALSQMKQWVPEVIDSFTALFETGRVELLSESSHHSLASVYSMAEFCDQVRLHTVTCKQHLQAPSRIFRNTELIYFDQVAEAVSQLNLDAMLCEGSQSVLGWRSPNHVYRGPSSVKLLPRHFQFSDDVAFRFANQAWEGYPLTAHKYAKWLEQSTLEADCINVFLDYETFGEHHKSSSGILDFLTQLPAAVHKTRSMTFATPSEVVDNCRPRDVLAVPNPVSWADSARDLSTWAGNHMQRALLEDLYALESAVKSRGDAHLLEVWRRLQTSDHFYYLSTKTDADGAVHQYFNPFTSPYHAYMVTHHILTDMRLKLNA